MEGLNVLNPRVGEQDHVTAVTLGLFWLGSDDHDIESCLIDRLELKRDPREALALIGCPAVGLTDLSREDRQEHEGL